MAKIKLNSKNLNNKVKSKAERDAKELEAFNIDVQLANYQARIENGELTAEERASRNRIRSILGAPLDDK